MIIVNGKILSAWRPDVIKTKSEEINHERHIGVDAHCVRE